MASEGESVDDVSENCGVYYKCCRNKQCKVSVCVNCYSFYHGSCVARSPIIKKLENNKVICCDQVNLEIGNKSKYMTSQEQLVEENELLKKLIHEMASRNDTLKENNMLLKENNMILMQLLQHKKDMFKIDKTTNNDGPTNMKTLSSDKNRINTNELSVEQVNKTIRDVNLQQHKQKQLKLMKDIIELNDPIMKDTNTLTNTVVEQASKTDGITVLNPDKVNNEDNGGKWTDVVKRKNRNRNTVKNISRGTGVLTEAKMKLKTVERPEWIYVSNLSVETTTEDVMKCLKEAGNYEFTCEPITHKYPNPRVKSFKIGVPRRLYDTIVTPEYWPAGVLVNRYYFPRRKDVNFTQDQEIKSVT